MSFLEIALFGDTMANTVDTWFNTYVANSSNASFRVTWYDGDTERNRILDLKELNVFIKDVPLHGGAFQVTPLYIDC